MPKRKSPPPIPSMSFDFGQQNRFQDTQGDIYVQLICSLWDKAQKAARDKDEGVFKAIESELQKISATLNKAFAEQEAYKSRVTKAGNSKKAKSHPNKEKIDQCVEAILKRGGKPDARTVEHEWLKRQFPNEQPPTLRTIGSWLNKRKLLK